MVKDGPGRIERRRAWRALAAALGLAWAATGCMSPVGTTAASALRKVRESPDPNIRHQAYEALGSVNRYDNENQKAEVVRELSARLDDPKEPTASRAVICRTLGRLGRPEAREPMLRALDSTDELVRAEACRALGRVGQADDATALARIMSADTSTDCRVAAVEGLGALKPKDPRIAVSLVEGMEHTDPAIRLASLRALRSITGRDLGVEAGPWKKLVQAAEPASDRPAAATRTADARPADGARAEAAPIIMPGAPSGVAGPGPSVRQ